MYVVEGECCVEVRVDRGERKREKLSSYVSERRCYEFIQTNKHTNKSMDELSYVIHHRRLLYLICSRQSQHKTQTYAE